MNVATLVAAMPGLSTALATTYLPLMEAAMREYQITSVPRSRMWLAQVGHESASLRYFEELASGSAYEGRQDLGNTQPGDGVKFHGRGPIQLTGRANYAAAGKALGLPLVENPTMAADPRYAFRVSAWWWASHGLNPIADADDVVRATRVINGGLNGLADRQARYDRIRALGDAVAVGSGPVAGPEPEPEPEPSLQEGDAVLSEPILDPDGVTHFIQIRSQTGAVYRWWVAPGKEPAHDQPFGPRNPPSQPGPDADPASKPIMTCTGPQASFTLGAFVERRDMKIWQGWLVKGKPWATRVIG